MHIKDMNSSSTTTTCDILRRNGFDATNGELIEYFFSTVFHYDLGSKPLPIEFNWSPLIHKQLDTLTFANEYNEGVVLNCLLQAFPSMQTNLRPLIALLSITKSEVNTWFARADTREQIVHLYVHLLNFALSFLTCMSERRQAVFGKQFLYKPVAATGYEYVDAFYSDTQDATSQLANLTKMSMGTSFSSIANILNNIMPLMSNLAYFNPDGKNQKAKTEAMLDKDRQLFDQMIRDGRLKGLAASYAALLPDASHRYTRREYEVLVQQRKTELANLHLEEKSADGKSQLTTEEREKLHKAANDTTQHGIDVWLLKNEQRINRLESKQEAFVRRVFPFGAKHEKAFTIIWRIIMAIDFSAPTWVPGMIALANMPLQWTLRQFSRPELYMVLMRILNHLPQQAPIEVYVNRVFDMLHISVTAFKPLLPLLNGILKYGYPVWTKFYKHIMAFITNTGQMIFHRLFPSQRMITVRSRQMEEALGGMMQLGGLAFRTYEMFGFFQLFWAYKIVKYIIKNYGLKIVGLVVALV